MIQAEGGLAGVVINPSTPVAALEEVLEVADYVLVMSVNPGFGGQQFIPRSLNKVRSLDRKRRDLGLGFAIEIDGGVAKENAAEIVRAGCDWLVVGSNVFATPDPEAAFIELRDIARGATAFRA
jgi:ribulose-phosphate 3-epimerase